MLINPHVLRSSIVAHTIGSHMAQAKHVLLTRFDLITRARCQGGTGRKKYSMAETMSKQTRQCLQFIILPGKNPNKFTFLCS